MLVPLALTPVAGNRGTTGKRRCLVGLGGVEHSRRMLSCSKRIELVVPTRPALLRQSRSRGVPDASHGTPGTSADAGSASRRLRFASRGHNPIALPEASASEASAATWRSSSKAERYVAGERVGKMLLRHDITLDGRSVLTAAGSSVWSCPTGGRRSRFWTIWVRSMRSSCAATRSRSRSASSSPTRRGPIRRPASLPARHRHVERRRLVRGDRRLRALRTRGTVHELCRCRAQRDSSGEHRR